MEKAFKLDFVNDKTGSLYVNCCGCSQTAPLHSFGPASKPHYLIHYVLSGKGHFRFHDKEYRLEAGYGFLIQPNELAFYQADAKDPWSYLWVGFAGSRAEEYLHSMGLSDRHPIFSCDKSEELYSIVRDMMEHNTFGIADDLRRNGLLGVFLSVIADSAGVVAREEEDKGNQYVKKAVSFIQSNYCNPIKVTDVADYVCINRQLFIYAVPELSGDVSPAVPYYLPYYQGERASGLHELSYREYCIVLRIQRCPGIYQGLSRYEGNVPFEVPQGKPQGEHKRTAPGGRGPDRPAPEAIDETIKPNKKGCRTAAPFCI